jgi:hypothetical protein
MVRWLETEFNCGMVTGGWRRIWRSQRILSVLSQDRLINSFLFASRINFNSTRGSMLSVGGVFQNNRDSSSSGRSCTSDTTWHSARTPPLSGTPLSARQR